MADNQILMKNGIGRKLTDDAPVEPRRPWESRNGFGQ
jgi:hypothetical protein